MLAQSRDTLFVAFMGTKQFPDILVNADARLMRLWPDEVPSSMLLFCLLHTSLHVRVA